MKRVDEKDLLLAVGQVGDDLLTRAEHPARSMPAYKRWGALAACLCLVICLGAYAVMEGIAQPGELAQDNGAVAGETAPNTVDGSHYSDCTDAENAVPEKGADADAAYYDGAACLKELGVTHPGLEILSVDGEAFRKTAGNKSEQTAGMTESEDALYDDLCAADVTAAEDEIPGDAVAVVLELESGETLEGIYSPAGDFLRLGGYDFYNKRLAGYFERSDGT